jgi:hypothetical protein
MRQFKDFLVTEDTITEDDGVLLPEGFVYDQEPLLEGVTAHKKIGDPPAVLIMRRTSIRMFPNGQRIALYKVDKINKYVTVPYTDDNWIMTTEPGI